MLAWSCAALLGVRLAMFACSVAMVPASGFVAHYTASRLLLEGARAGAFYDDARFIEAVHRFEPGVTDIFGANPPTVALTAIPQATVRYGPARIGQVVAVIAVWLVILIGLGRAVGLDGPWLGAFVSLGLLFDPLFANVRDAHMHVFVLALMLLAWSGWRHNIDRRTGCPIGAVLALKATGFVFWPMLAVQRRWGPIGWALVVFSGLAVTATLALGIEAWPLFLQRARALGTSGSLSATAYQSIISLVRRLTVPDTRWNPDPLLEMPDTGIALSWMLAGAMLAVSLVAAAKRRDDALFASFAALALATSPVSLDAHYALALFPIAVLLGLQKERIHISRGMLLAAAAAMIALDLPYRSPRIGSGLLAVFAYPKLYGALVLWALCLTERPANETGEER